MQNVHPFRESDELEELKEKARACYKDASEAFAELRSNRIKLPMADSLGNLLGKRIGALKVESVAILAQLKTADMSESRLKSLGRS